MPFIDGFVIPVPKKNLAVYTRMARKACKIWMEHGVLDYKECVGDELNVKFCRRALGAEVEMMLRFQESPEPPPPGMLTDKFGLGRMINVVPAEQPAAA